MILGFKKEFKDKILNGSKIHTIRLDPNDRWKVGNKIHFATGVRTKRYNQFKSGFCLSIDSVRIYPISENVKFDNRYLTGDRLEKFAVNDGFDNSTQLFEFFLENYPSNYTFKVIHWTNVSYNNICKCGAVPMSNLLHTCPYQQDINGDSVFTCNCCVDCCNECAQDI